MLNLTFREIKRVDLIENGKVAHYFKIKYLDNSTAVFDNSWNQLETSKIMENNNMATKFQKRHYEHIARSIKALAIVCENNEATHGYEMVSIPVIISALCRSFKKDNQNFSASVFLEALNLNPDAKKFTEQLIDDRKDV
tara:strand:+ start:61 stop:477 length:417 start_codon:yes stop_codon:yes gene_type:complete